MLRDIYIYIYVYFFFAMQKIGSNLKYRDKEKVNDDIYPAWKTMCAQWL